MLLDGEAAAGDRVGGDEQEGAARELIDGAMVTFPVPEAEERVIAGVPCRSSARRRPRASISTSTAAG